MPTVAQAAMMFDAIPGRYSGTTGVAQSIGDVSALGAATWRAWRSAYGKSEDGLLR
jgi:hypothetical protein